MIIKEDIIKYLQGLVDKQTIYHFTIMEKHRYYPVGMVMYLVFKYESDYDHDCYYCIHHDTIINTVELRNVSYVYSDILVIKPTSDFIEIKNKLNELVE